MHTTLLKSQRNRIFSIARDHGLDPTQFEWTKVDSRWQENEAQPVDKLVHIPTGHYFIFDRYKHAANPLYMPSENRLVERDAGQLGTWQEVEARVASWLNTLKGEILEPDLWELAKSDRKLVAASIDQLENSQFSVQEQDRIRLAIKELHEFLKLSARHSEDQMKFIESRLKHLEEAASRLGRKDWITLAMGTLTNIVVGVALAPDAAKELLRTAGALFGWVVGGLQLLL